MLLEQVAQDFSIALSTDSTSASFPSRVATGTEPTGNGVLNCRNSGGIVQNVLDVMPFGTGSDNDVFSMRVYGWSKVGNDPTSLLWIPRLLVELACTVSASVGVAGRVIDASHRFVDTITLVTGNDDISVDIVSPTGDVPAHALISLKGASKVEFTFDQTTGTPSMNTLAKFL